MEDVCEFVAQEKDRVLKDNEKYCKQCPDDNERPVIINYRLINVPDLYDYPKEHVVHNIVKIDNELPKKWSFLGLNLNALNNIWPCLTPNSLLLIIPHLLNLNIYNNIIKTNTVINSFYFVYYLLFRRHRLLVFTHLLLHILRLNLFRNYCCNLLLANLIEMYPYFLESYFFFCKIYPRLTPSSWAVE